MDDHPPLTLPPGTVIGGKFRVEGLLGQGAMGVVLSAVPIDGGAPVAIKILQAEALERNEALARFEREVRVVRKLESPHVARIFDSGTLDDGSPYMAIEHLHGRELAIELETREMLPVEEAVDYCLQALGALTEAHAAGIVHRDLKPSNLYLHQTADGARVIKVLDFGISKHKEGEPAQTALTKTHSLIGSPLYMSPEQIMAARDVDPRSDLWSLGVVLFEMLTGRTPFNDGNVGKVLSNVLTASIPSLRALRPDVPRPIEQIVRACLERSVEKRYPNGVALARDLAPFASPAGRAVLPTIEAFAARFERTSWSAIQPEQPESIGERPTVPNEIEATSTRDPDGSTPQLPVRSMRGPVVALCLLLALLASVLAAVRFTAGQ